MKRIYIDLDGVCANFDKMLNELAPELYLGEGDDYEVRSKMVDDVLNANPNTFQKLDLIHGAKEAVTKLAEKYDIRFLSTPCYNVIDSYSDKRIWLEIHFGDLAKKKLNLTHDKSQFKGDYIIDDRTRNGVTEFDGEHIHFGTERFPDWASVLEYFNV